VTYDPVFSLATAAGHAIGAAAGAALIERFAGGRGVFRSVRFTLRGVSFILATAVVPALLPGLLGSWTGGLFGDQWTAFPGAWLGQATGTLVVAPCVLIAMTTAMRRPRRRDWPILVEGALLFALLTLTALVVLAGFIPSDVKTYPLEFLCLPFLLWAAFRFGPREATLAVATLSGIAVWGTVRGAGPFADGTPADAMWLLQAYIGVMSITGIVFATTVDEQRRAEKQLQELATTDPLTGLVNYRRLLDVLRLEMARSRRTGRPFSVLLVDMDGLKRINDRHGHLAGSRALCRVADVLRRSTRETDVVSRFGGDEFAIVLPESGNEGGNAVLSRVSENLRRENAEPALSVSGGHAVFPRDGDSPTLLLRAADQRLYAAKHGQTEAVVVATETLAEVG
jgi:diguanylate cyclase (GGDEF)-like protein